MLKIPVYKKTISNCPQCGIDVTVPEVNRSHVYLYKNNKCDWEKCMRCNTMFSMSNGEIHVDEPWINISSRK